MRSRSRPQPQPARARSGHGGPQQPHTQPQPQSLATTDKIVGKCSTFGPPGEAAGPTADGQHTSADPGIALYRHDTLGQQFMVVIKGVDCGGQTCSAILTQIDYGPAPSTGRKIDITGAGAQLMGIDPAHFPTDAVAEAAPYGGTLHGSGSEFGGAGNVFGDIGGLVSATIRLLQTLFEPALWVRIGKILLGTIALIFGAVGLLKALMGIDLDAPGIVARAVTRARTPKAGLTAKTKVKAEYVSAKELAKRSAARRDAMYGEDAPF